jgi:hypothetical protein
MSCLQGYASRIESAGLEMMPSVVTADIQILGKIKQASKQSMPLGGLLFSSKCDLLFQQYWRRGRTGMQDEYVRLEKLMIRGEDGRAGRVGQVERKERVRWARKMGACWLYYREEEWKLGSAAALASVGMKPWPGSLTRFVTLLHSTPCSLTFGPLKSGFCASSAGPSRWPQV